MIGLVIPQILEALRNVVVNLDAAVPRLREWLNQILADSPGTSGAGQRVPEPGCGLGGTGPGDRRLPEIRQRGGLAGSRGCGHRVPQRDFQQRVHIYDRLCIFLLYFGTKGKALQPGVPDGTCLSAGPGRLGSVEGAASVPGKIRRIYHRPVHGGLHSVCDLLGAHGPWGLSLRRL